MKKVRFFEGQTWDTFEPDPTICINSAWSSLLRYSTRSTPMNIFPGEPGTQTFIKNNDTRVANMKVELAEKCTAECPIMRDKFGYSGANGVIDNFHSCKTDNMPWRTLISPLPDNARQRADLKLASTWRTNAHKQIFYKLAQLMTQTWIPGNVKVAKYSSSGPPLYTNRANEKIAYVKPMFKDLEWILSRASKRDVLALWEKHRLVIAYRVGERLQADKWNLENGLWRPKERIVPDFMYALSDGKKGRSGRADNACEWDPRLVRSRTRNFYGMASPPNLLLAIFFQGINNGLFKNYPVTFKSHGAPDIEEKINRWDYHVAIDVSNHDFLVPRFMMEPLFEVLRKRFDERVVDLIELVWQAPAFVPWPNLNEPPRPYWLGHPLVESTFKNWFGLPSGIFLVSFVGKFGCMGAYFCKLYDMGIDVLSCMERILRWEHPDVSFLDMGDDAVGCFSTRSLADRFTAELAKVDYYVTGVEPAGFTGFTFAKDKPTDKHVHVYPSAISYIVKPLARERNINTRLHPFWAHGFESREAVYRPMPKYSTLNELYHKSFRDHFGYSFETALHATDNYQEKLPSLTLKDRLAIENPERVHFLFEEGELSPEIEALFSTKLKEEEYVDYVTPFIK